MSQRQPSEIFMTTKTHSTNCDNKLRELLESMDSLHPQLPEAPASPDSLHAEVIHLLSDYFFVPEAWKIFICFFILPGTAWTIGQYGEGSRSGGGISQTHGGHAACRGKFCFFWPFAMLIPVYFLTSWLNRGKTTRIGLKGPRSSLSRPPARRRGHNVTPHHWYRVNPFLTLRIQRYVSVSR